MLELPLLTPLAHTHTHQPPCTTRHYPRPHTTDDPTQIRAALREHWRKVVQRQPANQRLYAAISRTYGTRITATTSDADTETFAATLARARSKAPGPDGLSAACWTAAGPRAANTLARLNAHLAAGHPPPRTLNDTTLVCIPKAAQDPSRTRGATAPSSTRPLGLKNVDVTAIATLAARNLVHPAALQLSHDQQGFLPGRTTLEAILSIDTATRCASWQHNTPATTHC